MSKGLNKAQIIGNLGNDPELKTMPNGTSVVTLSLATTETWKDKTTGQPQERTEWHRVVFYGKTAEIAGQYLVKGSKVYVEGSLRTREWMKEGQKRYTTEIIGRDMQMLDGRSKQAENEGRLNENKTQQSHAAPQPPEDFDDDIPF